MTVFDCLDPVSRRDGIDAATTAARGGRLVVLPTDTVYGIGADAFSPAAVRDLLAAKGRGPDMPVPVLIGSTGTLAGLVVAIPPHARLLMDAFWPGGLSLILEHAPSLSWNLGDTRNTVMVRMPLHPVALELLRAVGPMAVSSANISGRPPATTAQQAEAQLSDSVSVFLDAGESPVGVASTVVDLTGETPLVRRVGAVSLEQLRAVLPEIEVPHHLLPADERPAPPEPDAPHGADVDTPVDTSKNAASDAPDGTDVPEPTLPSTSAVEPDVEAPSSADPEPAATSAPVTGPAATDAAAEPDVEAPAHRPAPDAGDPAVGETDEPVADATVASGHESTQEAGPDPVAEEAPTGRHAERPDIDRF